MENIIEKLSKIQNEKNPWGGWSLEEVKKLLEMYLIISKNEAAIFDLIYSYHGCDSWEDIFRDYNPNNIDDKVTGVEVAIEQVDELIKEKS